MQPVWGQVMAGPNRLDLDSWVSKRVITLAGWMKYQVIWPEVDGLHWNGPLLWLYKASAVTELLDKVQKGKLLTAKEAKILKSKKLIEGKRPNLHISSKVAKQTHQENDYIKLRGIDDAYAKKIMIDYLNEFEKAKRSDFFKVLVDKLPDILNENQKENKIKNYLQELRIDGQIEINGKYWKMAKK